MYSMTAQHRLKANSTSLVLNGSSTSKPLQPPSAEHRALGSVEFGISPVAKSLPTVPTDNYRNRRCSVKYTVNRHHECQNCDCSSQHSSHELPPRHSRQRLIASVGLSLSPFSCFTTFPSIGTTVADLTSGRNTIESRKVSMPSNNSALLLWRLQIRGKSIDKIFIDESHYSIPVVTL